VRFKVASQNGINYQPHECTLEGECLGTCPKCEEEAEFVMNELRKMYKEGKSIHIDPISLSELMKVEDVTLLSFDKDYSSNVMEEDDGLLGDFD
jgi:hypothetical protein